MNNECNHALFLTAVACQLFDCLDLNELSLLSADMIQLADTIAAMIARNAVCGKDNE